MMRAVTRLLVGVVLCCATATSSAAARPNVLLVMTDDQGWGDVGVHGNDKVRTPNLDALAREGVRFSRFYAGPVCTPTRASVMTGRYHLRTRAIDTFSGRAIIHPDEVTLAEMLSKAGYRTGIFGKWHLGDHYPSRAFDQGFAEALVHHGGGIGQPSDPPEGNSYFNSWLEHNGKLMQAKGYCSNVFTDAAIRFIETSAGADAPSFFLYLAFNAPHVPLQVKDELVRPYREAGFDEKTAKTYAMITNIDANVGRVLKTLCERKLDRDTLVIFMSDNGSLPGRFNGNLRGDKGSTYEGGIRVPCFVRWPAGFTGDGRVIDRIAAHIDLLPTILAACGLAPPKDVKLDGMNLLPLLTGQAGAWPDRTLYFQWHRGDAPELGRNCAALSQRLKLVQTHGAPAKDAKAKHVWELYDVIDDPGEQRDLAAGQAAEVAELRRGYQTWFADVGSSRGFDAVPIHVGSEHENPVLLTRQDRRGAEGTSTDDVGFWAVHVARAGKYDVTLIFEPADAERRAALRMGDALVGAIVPAGTREHTFRGIQLDVADRRLQASVEAGTTKKGVLYVRVERVD